MLVCSRCIWDRQQAMDTLLDDQLFTWASIDDSAAVRWSRSNTAGYTHSQTIIKYRPDVREVKEYIVTDVETRWSVWAK